MQLSASGYIAKATTRQVSAPTGCRLLKKSPKRCKLEQETQNCVKSFSGFLNFTTEVGAVKQKGN